jgi:hypothetical protein
MAQKIGYNGIPEFDKPRKLVEDNVPYDSNTPKADLKPPPVDSREEATYEIFRQLATTYLKGEKLKKGLAGMDPANYIPIEASAGEVAAAARRLNKEQSNDGTIITYSMFQKCVDEIYAKKWEIRRRYFNTGIPVTGPGQRELISNTTQTTTQKGMLQAFIEGSGVEGAFLATLIMAPFLLDVFGVLTEEEFEAKVAHYVKVSAGIALLLELGFKVYKIMELLKSLNVKIPEEDVNKLANSEEERSRALEAVGIDHQDLKNSFLSNDNKKIVDYVGDYYSRYGGLIEPNGYLTIDHWIAYLHVSQNQQLVRGALNNADAYSQKFSSIRAGGENPNISSTTTDTTDTSFPKIDISIQLVSVTKTLKEKSDTIYDDILNAFMYQITDQDICCLVSLFGAFNDTDMLRTIAAVLRILCMDLAGEIANLLNAIKKAISNMLMAAIFELVAQMDKVMQEVLLKLVKTFTVSIPGLEQCIGLLSIGWAIINSIQALFKMIKELIREIISIINDYGMGANMTWSVAADRRHLLGIARILEVVAARIDVAKVCDTSGTDDGTVPLTNVEIKDLTAADVIYKIIGKPPPTLNLSNQEIEKYFPDLQSKTSQRLKFKYGILDMQNSKSKEGKACADPLPKDALDEIVNKLKSILNEE